MMVMCLSESFFARSRQTFCHALNVFTIFLASSISFGRGRVKVTKGNQKSQAEKKRIAKDKCRKTVENAKKDEKEATKDDDEEMEPQEASRYRALTASKSLRLRVLLLRWVRPLRKQSRDLYRRRRRRDS